jgi:hypothetical protein
MNGSIGTVILGPPLPPLPPLPLPPLVLPLPEKMTDRISGHRIARLSATRIRPIHKTARSLPFTEPSFPSFR